jgi:septal ring factor EnvC (AmiA/AmiB activator)
MDAPSTDNLRAELAALEAKAAQLSQMRNHLQHQIDFGFETSSTREREREISDERNELHQRIDSLKETLRASESV